MWLKICEGVEKIFHCQLLPYNQRHIRRENGNVSMWPVGMHAFTVKKSYEDTMVHET